MPSLGTLGRYQIIREIARSNDIVYEAYDEEMDRRVALKELMMPQGATEKQRTERRARFKREAKAAGKLEHPNIVTVYEVGEDSGRLFIAMEFLEGPNLRQRIDSSGPVAQSDAIEIVNQVLDGLSFAHDKGVVHRDIKPDNIQLLPDGRVKITDFGIARLMFEPSITVDGQIFGTPSYMSPEQVVGREIDLRTDIWSAGVVLFEAISGDKPFTGDSVVTISHKIMHEEPEGPADASWAVSQVLRKAMDKSASQRFASANRMKAALLEALTNPGQAGATPHQVPASGSPYQPWGAPLDPYAQSGQQAPPPPQPVAYGQPYNQQSNPQSGNPPPPVPMGPFPPGWTAPPKRPMLSPAANEFLKRTMGVVIIGGIIMALAIWGISTITRMAEERVSEQLDASLRGAIVAAVEKIPSDPASSREELVSLLNTAQSVQVKDEIGSHLAEADIQLAQRAEAVGDRLGAEAYLREAVTIAPDNADAHAAYARFLGRSAAASTEPPQQLQTYAEADSQWTEAASRASDDAARRAFETEHALLLIQRGDAQAANSNTRDAELAYQNAIAKADSAGDGSVASMARRRLADLRR